MYLTLKQKIYMFLLIYSTDYAKVIDLPKNIYVYFFK